eukprot:1010641-Pyramimonas_sp.AAC.1
MCRIAAAFPLSFGHDPCLRIPSSFRRPRRRPEHFVSLYHLAMSSANRDARSASVVPPKQPRSTQNTKR